MPVDPQCRLVLDAIASMGMPEMWEVPVDKLRAMTAKQRAMMPPGPDALVEDRVVPTPHADVPVRIYRPPGTGSIADGLKLPALLWFHGGGWVLGSIAESDADCRSLATLAGVCVVSVEYRMAPEHVFPAAADDCYAVTTWVAANAAALGIDPARLAVGGDSAGGNLAAAVSLMLRDRSGPSLRFVLAVYPVTDLGSMDTPSYRENAEGYFLTRKTMQWFRAQYTPNEADRDDPRASPLRADDLHGLPPALVITAEYDPLRDEGEAYAARLKEAGVSVTQSRYDGAFHGFFSLHAFVDLAKRAHEEAGTALRAALA
jgi:acetyl esterase